ncbi:MAG: hypothetical protein EOP87_10005 [Verrucomicrobiaceae bacterium]|nr:MAG: hypothetical protein EOP87_10005 [Verrucomicrobiaceae bacterium]
MNSARPSLLLHLLSACALMAYTVVACTVTPAPVENPDPTTEVIVVDADGNTPPSPAMERAVK